MTDIDTPARGTPDYARAGIMLLAKTAHIWAGPAVIAADAHKYGTTISVNDHDEGARIARLLGVTGEPTTNDTAVPGVLFIAHHSVIDGMDLTVRSQEPDPDSEVAP